MTQSSGSAPAGLPALAEHQILRYVAFTLLYAAQGLPYGLLSVAVIPFPYSTVQYSRIEPLA